MLIDGVVGHQYFADAINASSLLRGRAAVGAGDKNIDITAQGLCRRNRVEGSRH